jgi:hypothetical protein
MLPASSKVLQLATAFFSHFNEIIQRMVVAKTLSQLPNALDIGKF